MRTTFAEGAVMWMVSASRVVVVHVERSRSHFGFAAPAMRHA